MSMETRWILGIDEAGRGPLAGPVAVGVVCVPSEFNWKKIPGVYDSKKLSEKKREEIFKVAKKLRRDKELDFAVSLVSAKIIDDIGIVSAIQRGIQQGIRRIVLRASDDYFLIHACVKLDGGLKAPRRFVNQEIIIRGDSKERVIGLASIVAKVIRDRYMQRISQNPEFSTYAFTQHKGYGTKIHRQAIAKYGLSKEHRKTYCTKIT